MDKEDLKKYTCINLRCVTQSSKDGVPLNQLQNDYKQLLGTAIPFKELGYSSLEHFLLDIRDVVCLKKKTDGSVVVESVADASTAHIAKLISKQKSSKKSKSGSAKPSVVRRTWGNCGKKNSQKNLKSSQKDFNIPLLSTPDIKHDQNSKFMQLSPAQQEFKKSVLVNLRSVVQSCKTGIPLNRLQKDYRKFIGSNIPFENLGYSTLYEFIESIPDVIELKEGLNDEFIAIGVVDTATAHLFPDTLKSKPLNPPIVQSKPSVNNKATLQISSEQKAKLPTSLNTTQNVLASSDLNNILKYPTSVKLENFISKKLFEITQWHPSTEELKKPKPLKVAEPVINSVIKSATLTRNDTISLQNQKKAKNPSNESFLSSANIVSTVNPHMEHHSSLSVWGNTVENRSSLSSCSSSTSKSDTQHEFNGLIQPEKTLNGVSSKSLNQDGSLKVPNCSAITKEDTKPSNTKNPVTLKTKKSEKARQKAERVQNEIKSNLTWIYFALYVPSNVETLKKDLQSFHGFPFSKDSTEWKEREDIISLLPKTAVKNCLNQLCIKFNSKDCRTSLQNKLINYFASHTTESGTEQEDKKPLKVALKTSEKARRKAERVQTEIKSNLAWIYFALLVPSNVETLKKELQSFHGFPFSKDSTEWKERKDIISLLPKTAVKNCLNQLCIKFNPKDCRTSLQNKLMDYFASYTKGSETEQEKIELGNNEKELYASTLTLSSVSSEVSAKCSSYYDTESSDAVLSAKNFDVSKTKSKISDSAPDYANKQSLMRENFFLQKNQKLIQAQQPNIKGNLLTQKSSSKKVKSVSEKQQSLDKTLEQKLEEEFSKTKTSAIDSPKKVKIKMRHRNRKKIEVAEKNNSVPVIKPIET